MFEASGKPLQNCDTNTLAQYALVPTAVHDQLHLAMGMVKQLSHGFLCCRRCARQLGVARDALQLTKNGPICAQFVNPNAILHDIVILSEVRVGGSDWMGKRWGWRQAFLPSHFVCVHVRHLHRSGGWRRHIGVERPSDCMQTTGMEAQGDPTEEFSWFPGYSWEYLHCDCCGTHIGWLYRCVCVCGGGYMACRDEIHGLGTGFPCCCMGTRRPSVPMVLYYGQGIEGCACRFLLQGTGRGGGAA